MAEHTDATIIANLRETVERLTIERNEARQEIEDNDYEFTTVHRQASQHIEKQAAELAELRSLVAAFGDGSHGMRWTVENAAMARCREYNRKRKVN